MSEVGVAGVEVPEMCVDGSSACLVCGDKGSGFHYSVFSCEGCKVHLTILSIAISSMCNVYSLYNCLLWTALDFKFAVAELLCRYCDCQMCCTSVMISLKQLPCSLPMWRRHSAFSLSIAYS